MWWYRIALDLVEVITALGGCASALLLFLLLRQRPVVPGLPLLVGAIGLTLTLLFITDIMLVEYTTPEPITMVRRLVGRTLLSLSVCWFLWTCMRRP